MKPLSKDIKILFYFYLFLLIIWLIFDSLKYSWTDDTFQKVILAPLGEEPFKLLLALMICLSTFIGLHLPKKSIKNKKDVEEKVKFLNVFCYTFVPFAIVSGIIFGVSEGPLFNILLHFSTTTIAAIFILIVFLKVKDKNMKIHWKIFAIFSSLILPMLLHSISNQYTNITYANNNPEFGYLVGIARFFESYSFSVGYYVLILFSITCILLYIFIYKFYISKMSKAIKR